MRQTVYEILQISEEADDVVIQAAYRALVKKYHPDVNKHPEATKKFQQIQNAYEQLSRKTTNDKSSSSILNDDENYSFHVTNINHCDNLFEKELVL